MKEKRMPKKNKLGVDTDFSYRIHKVLKVVDGDTIDVILDMGFDILYKQRVRLFGIDTPESRTRDKVEKKYGLLAKKFLKDCLASAGNKVIKTHKGEEKGKFGRILGEIYVNGVNINILMCSKGHAVEYHGQNKSLVENAHLANRKKHKV